MYCIINGDNIDNQVYIKPRQLSQLDIKKFIFNNLLRSIAQYVI